jgi:hypothetical protein
MPYIVKSSLEIGSTIIPWSEQQSNKLIKEKQEFLEKKVSEQVVLEPEVVEEVPEEEKQPEIKEEKKIFKNNKRSQKAGEK